MCIIHKWTKWSEPRQVKMDYGYAMIQSKKCEKCNKYKWRFYN